MEAYSKGHPVWYGRSRRSNFYPSFNYIWSGEHDRLDVIEDVVVKGSLYTKNYVSDRYRCRLSRLRKYVSQVKMCDLALKQKVASEKEYGSRREGRRPLMSKVALAHKKESYGRWHWNPMCGDWQRRCQWLKGSLEERKILLTPSLFRFGALKELYDSGIKPRSKHLESEAEARKAFLVSGKSFKSLPRYSMRFRGVSDGDKACDRSLDMCSTLQGFSRVQRPKSLDQRLRSFD